MSNAAIGTKNRVAFRSLDDLVRFVSAVLVDGAASPVGETAGGGGGGSVGASTELLQPG